MIILGGNKMIRPLNGNVVLKKELKENKTASGILLSQKQEEEEFATVISLSEIIDEKGNKISINLKEGDKVLFKNYSPTKVSFNDEEYLVISYKDILAVIE